MEDSRGNVTSDPSALGPEKYYQMIDKEGIIDTWLLVRSPFPVISLISIYLLLVLHLGPKYMKGREPYQLNRLMQLYNLLQVGYNLWMLHLVLFSSNAARYLIYHSCHPADPSNTVDIRYVFHLSAWHYLCSKIIDLLDTCIMVLRKKQCHVTYLHLYHHVAMVFFTWLSMKYIRAQQGTPPLILNNFVHVIMYGYYFLASFGPEVQRYLWWKRYITRLQLLQFALVIAYLAYLYCNQCEVSQAFNVIWISNVSIIAAFFVNFYLQTYIFKPRNQQEKNNKQK